jgi:uncharacterized protein (UPF0276 family)
MFSAPGLKPQSVGIGWRHPHHAELLAQRPSLGVIEVHAENFFGAGGAALQLLAQAGEHYPLSLHGVGLGLGSAAGLDPWHLDQLAALVQRSQPVLVSDHACFARAPLQAGGAVLHANDLLPIAFTDASLALMVRHLTQVQERLRRPMLVENISACVRWADDTWAEPDFFNTLARRSGCGLLLDLNNLVVNALNADLDPVAAACAWVDAIDPHIVGEIHLAGHRDLGDIVIDDHGSGVPPSVWAVYAHALQRLGPRPTVIEWDTDVPELPVLLGEAAQARAMQDTLCRSVQWA